MNQKIFALGLGALLSAISFPAHAQKEAPIPRVGILRAGAPPRDGSPDEFVSALRDVGYIENKNIVLTSDTPTVIEVDCANLPKKWFS